VVGGEPADLLGEVVGVQPHHRREGRSTTRECLGLRDRSRVLPGGVGLLAGVRRDRALGRFGSVAVAGSRAVSFPGDGVRGGGCVLAARGHVELGQTDAQHDDGGGRDEQVAGGTPAPCGQVGHAPVRRISILPGSIRPISIGLDGPVCCWVVDTGERGGRGERGEGLLEPSGHLGRHRLVVAGLGEEAAYLLLVVVLVGHGLTSLG